MILHGTYLDEGTTRFVAWAEIAIDSIGAGFGAHK